MVRENNLWKVAVILYIICYLSISLIIFMITNKGSIGVIIVMGMIVVLPYIIYNLLKKKPVQVDNPDIKNLY